MTATQKSDAATTAKATAWSHGHGMIGHGCDRIQRTDGHGHDATT